jgi:hypothetical protein
MPAGSYKSVAGTFGRCACESRLSGQSAAYTYLNTTCRFHSSTDEFRMLLSRASAARPIRFLSIVSILRSQ